MSVVVAKDEGGASEGGGLGRRQMEVVELGRGARELGNGEWGNCLEKELI